MALERVIPEAAADPSVAYRVTLLADERLPTVRAAFKRAKARVGADAVNLVTVGGDLYIAATAQRRGRRRKGGLSLGNHASWALAMRPDC